MFICAPRFAGKRYTFPERAMLKLNQRPLPRESSEGFLIPLTSRKLSLIKLDPSHCSGSLFCYILMFSTRVATQNFVPQAYWI